MKLVILDGYAANPGDQSWGKLEQLAEVQVYDRTPPEQVVERALDAEIVLTNKTVITREAIASLRAEVAEFCKGTRQNDDLTAVILKRKAERPT